MSIRFYNDPTLNEVMSSLMPFERESLFHALNACALIFQQQQLIVDARCLVAFAIVSSMIHNCHHYGKICAVGHMRAQIERIVNAIEPSLRWKTFSKNFWKWLSEFNLTKSGIKEFKILNEFEELLLGFVSFADMETREKKRIERSFRRFVEEAGLESYDQFSNVFSLLVDITRRFEDKPRLYEEGRVVQLENELGLKQGVLVLGEEWLNDTRLSEVHQSILPMFSGGRPGMRIGVQRQPLAFLNIPQRLCFALERPRKEIIEGAYKGPIFEDFLCNLLRGELVVAIDPNDPLGGYIQRADRLRDLSGGEELLGELKKSSEVRAWEKASREWEYFISEPKLAESEMRFVRYFSYLRYNYRLPPGQNRCGVVIRSETHPSFEEFLQTEKTREWEEDLLLLHDRKPKHCLVAQAKFTAKYSHNKYRDGRNHVKKFAEYVERNTSPKSELGIPKDFVLLPALFTSFTGAIHKEDDGVLKTTIFPVLRNQFLSQVKAWSY